MIHLEEICTASITWLRGDDAVIGMNIHLFDCQNNNFNASRILTITATDSCCLVAFHHVGIEEESMFVGYTGHNGMPTNRAECEALSRSLSDNRSEIEDILAQKSVSYSSLEKIARLTDRLYNLLIPIPQTELDESPTIEMM